MGIRKTNAMSFLVGGAAGLKGQGDMTSLREARVSAEHPCQRGWHSVNAVFDAAKSVKLLSPPGTGPGNEAPQKLRGKAAARAFLKCQAVSNIGSQALWRV